MMTTKVNNSNNKALSNDPYKEFPGFSVTASPTSDTGCDIWLYHTLFSCVQPWYPWVLEDRKVSFIFGLYIHTELFPLAEESG